MSFTPGQTLTAAELNQLVPPNGGLLGGTGTTFAIVNPSTGLNLAGGNLTANYQAGTLTSFGTGLTLSTGVLAPNWQAGTVTTVGTGLSISGGTITASALGSVTDVETGALLTGGPITSTGTISVAAIAATSLIANAGSVSAVPSAVPIGNGLAFNSGTLEATGATSNVWFYKADTAINSGTPPVGSLYWNNATQTSATVIALSHITTDGIDVDLFIDLIAAGNTLVIQLANSSPDFQTWTCNGAITVHANSYVEVPVALVSSGGVGTTGFSNNAKLFVALIATAAAGAAGGVLSGTYPNPGFASIAAARILANSGTASAAPAATPIGAGLAFTSGTLTATGSGGTVTQVVAGTGLNGGTITTSGTITANYQAGTLASFATGLSLVGTALTPAVAAAGNGIAINSGTISVVNAQTLTGTAAGTVTIGPATGTSDVILNMPATGGTVTVAAAPAFQYQKAVLHVKQGATAGVVTLNSGFVYASTGGPGTYTASATANAVDMLGLYSRDGTHWVVDGILNGVP